MANSLTQDLVAILQRPVDGAARGRAALHLLDWIGCAALGATAPAGRALARYGADQAEGPAFTLGAGRRDAAAAAFVNGGVGNIFEMDDLHRTSIVHAGDVVIPAALAVGQREGADASGILTALVRGYEATIRIGIAAGPGHYRHWYNTATCGVFGAAAAAASLLGLDPERMVDALAQAGSQAAGVWQCRMEPGHSKQLNTARAAQSGVIAADLAGLGFPGPRRILEGEHGFFAAMGPAHRPEAVGERPDGPWLIFETSFKPWPACRHSHPVIEAGLALRNGGRNSAVTRITVETYEEAVAFCDNPSPDSPHAARFSLQHCIATTLLNGAPTLADCSLEAIADDEVAALRSRVEVRALEAFSDAFPRHYGARVEIAYDDGTVRDHRVTTAKGDPENPMTEQEIRDKALMLLQETGAAPADAERVVTAALALADGGDMAVLLAALEPLNRQLMQSIKKDQT